ANTSANRSIHFPSIRSASMAHCRMCIQMIVFDLLCAKGHRFEGWFGSAGDFASQKEGHLLQCPTCNSAEVERVPSAARFNLGAPDPRAPKRLANRAHLPPKKPRTAEAK